MRGHLQMVHGAALALAFTMLAGDAYARPGRGGSYHGGGGGGVSHGGGGGFGGSGVHTGYVEAPSWTIFFFFAIVALVVFLQVRQRLSNARSSRAAPPDLSNVGVGSVPSPLAAICARDPALSVQSIATRVQRMEHIVREAWCAGNMRLARPFVSDGVFCRFQVQLELMRQENRRNVMSDARVVSTTIETAEDADPLDVVHVRITAEARDTEVPSNATDDQIRAALARTRVEPYSEIWSLVRRRGALSKPGDFDVGRACPSCGGPLDGGETIKCRYCGALVCSGEYDWVVAEITQLAEWRPSAGEPPGYDELRRRDPQIAREALEDRASYIFWKWIQAGQRGELAHLRKCTEPTLIADQGDLLHLTATRGAIEVAVGGVDLVGCEVGGADGFDRAAVEVFWSARFGGSSAYVPSTVVLRLRRRSGVVSKLSMTALVCPNCGAPLAETDSAACDHCRVDLAGGTAAWVLDAVTPGRSR